MATSNGAEPVYGYSVCYSTHDMKELQCHYVGNEKTVRRKVMKRPKAKTIISMAPLNKKQYVATYGQGRM